MASPTRRFRRAVSGASVFTFQLFLFLNLFADLLGNQDSDCLLKLRVVFRF